MSRQDAKSDLPKSNSEAKSHITQIREALEKAKKSGLTNIVDKAIVALSGDLYQNNSHFVLELLQNADDSSYDVPEPALVITLRDDTIRFDANEVGFTRTNVDALCNLGSSSKVGSYRATGHKGIGFKSVFKVADRVWIRSGHYSFMFDARQRLGTLNPIWTTFPDTEQKGYSSIRLQFRRNIDISALEHHLLSLDAKLLLFLRKIQSIKIQIMQKDGQRVQAQRILIRRQDSRIVQGLRKLTLEPGYASPFLVSSHRTFRLGHDKRRKGWNYSDMLIAFPEVSSKVPFREPQNVYSFLPIRSYGFKFIIQADFLLTASREDIDNSSNWNLRLRDELPWALLTAIHRLNARGLYHIWLSCLIFDNHQPGFLEGLGQETLKLLSRQPILKSKTGELMPPSELTRIPDTLADTDGGSMFPRAFFQYTLVSPELTSKFTAALDGLGVRTLSDDEFLLHLSYFIQTCPRVFQSQPSSWHSQLATILFRLARIPLHRARVAKLPIILLQDGRWVHLDAGQLLLPLASSVGPAPKGIPAFEVHRDVAQDPSRLRLIQEFGARESGLRTICDIITRTHEDMKFPPQSFETDHLISHVVFLYRAQWVLSSISRKIWFVAEDGCCHRGDRMYVDSDSEYSAKMLFTKEHRAQVCFLHKEYECAFARAARRNENTKQWKQWVQENFGITYLPRLVTTLSGDDEAFVLSRDFIYLMDHKPSQMILELLKHNWAHYCQWIQETPIGADEDNKKLSKQRVRSQLSDWYVRCCDGSAQPLGKTHLPRKNVLVGLGVSTFSSQLRDQSHEYPFLDIPDPEDSGWNFLQSLEVIVELRPIIFIRRLRDLRGTNVAKDCVSILYEQIVACAEDTELDMIRQSFAEQELIFIPPTESHAGSWRGPDGCTWDGFPCLEKIPDLKRHYPSHQHETLFRKYLSVPIANLKTLVCEVKQITSSDSLAYIRDLLITTSRRIGAATYAESTDARLYQQLKGCKIWPITQLCSSNGFESLMANTDMWYVPDRDHLLETFSGKLPFLAFDTVAIAQLGQLLRSLMLDKRIISKVARSKTSVVGEAHFLVDYTIELMAKAGSIARLVPLNHEDRSTILSRLADIRVYQPRQVVVQWTVTTQSQGGDIVDVDGHEEPGRVSVEAKPDGIDIYLVLEDGNIHCPPLELIEELAACCGITSPEHIQLLAHILVEHDIQRISRVLNRRGIPNAVAGFNMATPKSPEPQPGNIKESSGVNDHLNNLSPQVQQSIANGSHRYRGSSPGSYIERMAEFGDVRNHHRAAPARPRMRSIKYGVMALSMPESFALGGQNETEDNFIGQLYVSSFLQDVVGPGYMPSVHWTSPLRNMAGHSLFQNQTSDTSTFTLQDTLGQFKGFLIEQGFQAAASLIEPTTFHIETIVTDQSLHSGFTLDAYQAKKAEKLSLARTTGTPLREAFILAVVYNLRDEPRVAFFDDPWRHYRGGSLSLEAPRGYWARFNETARPFHVRDAASVQATSLGENGRYRYRDLLSGEMRLFKLSFGTDDEPLQGTIRHVLVDSGEQYQALSYVWGDVSCSMAPYYIDTPEGVLRISFSLHSALRAIRDPDIDTVLWIDAICINQESVTEKAIQIRHLRTIFQSATQVVAWLGQDNQSQNGGAVIRNLESLARFARQSESTCWSNFLDSIKAKNESSSEVWADLDAFLDRPWFKRVWIVQELVLPERVTLVCGRSTIDWEDFFEAVQLCEQGLNLGGCHQIDDVLVLQHASPLYALGMARKAFREGRNKFGFLRLLDMFAHCQATKLVDRLFALLGLGSDCGEEAFNPDYDSTMHQVVQRYATRFAQRGQVMELLCRAGINKSYTFCSWIPEWTRHSFPQTISTWDAAKGRFYAGRHEHPTAHVVETPDSGLPVLHISGLSVDKITSVDTLRGVDKDGNDYADAAADFRTFIDFIHSYPSGESKSSVLVKLPIGDAKKPHLESTTDRLLAYRGLVKQAAHDWPDNLEELVWGGRKRSLEEEKVVKEYWQTSRAFMNRISKAAFCRTKGGYAGLVPGGSQTGDEICIFGGCKAPLVLRRRTGSEYTLVGECYIHGRMYGVTTVQKAYEREFCLV